MGIGVSMVNFSHISRALFSLSSTQAEPQPSSGDHALIPSCASDVAQSANAEGRDKLPLILGSLRPGEMTRHLWRGALNGIIRAMEQKRASEDVGGQGVITGALIYNLLIPYFLEKPSEGELMLGEDYDQDKIKQIARLAELLQKHVPNLFEVDLEAAKRLIAKAPTSHLRVVGEPKVTLEEVMDVFPVLKEQCRRYHVNFGVVNSRDDLLLPPTLIAPAPIPELPPQEQTSEVFEKTPPSNNQRQDNPEPMVYPELGAKSTYQGVPSFPAQAPMHLSIPAAFVSYEIRDGLVYKNGKLLGRLESRTQEDGSFSHQWLAIPMIETFGAGAMWGSKLGGRLVFALRSSRMLRLAAGVTGVGLAFFVGSELLLWKLED